MPWLRGFHWPPAASKLEPELPVRVRHPAHFRSLHLHPDVGPESRPFEALYLLLPNDPKVADCQRSRTVPVVFSLLQHLTSLRGSDAMFLFYPQRCLPRSWHLSWYIVHNVAGF